MRVNITGHHIDVTEALREYVEKKIVKLEHHFTPITNAHVILKLDNREHHLAEATLHLSQGELFASTEHENMYAAIDLLMDKLDKQVVKHKQLLEQRGHGA